MAMFPAWGKGYCLPPRVGLKRVCLRMKAWYLTAVARSVSLLLSHAPMLLPMLPTLGHVDIESRGWTYVLRGRTLQRCSRPRTEQRLSSGH